VIGATPARLATLRTVGIELTHQEQTTY
jgi:hypothetical protein